MPQTQTIEQMQEELFSMKRKLNETPQTIGGAYNRKYYSLKAQIKNKQDILDKAKLEAWLAQ